MKIGIIGAGQLAQMIAQSVKPLGIQCIAISDTQSPPALSDATVWYANDNNIEQLILDLAQQTDRITFDYEHVPDRWLTLLEKTNKTSPSVKSILIAKDRKLEKEFCNALGIPVGPFKMIQTADDVKPAYEAIGPEVIIKSCQGGYDGKHQWRANSLDDCQAFIDQTENFHHIMEAKIPFYCEVSQCAVRNKQGSILFYPLFRNEHTDGILDKTICPDPEFINSDVEKQAQQSTQQFLEALDYVGVCTIEFFVTHDHKVLLNEVAPRVHNSGHHTIESCQTSQFENHARAILNLPLGNTALVTSCVMENILSTMPALERILKNPKAHPHIYGKEERVGRKLGHITYVR
jgi:5-(carboxyamino)imidazole ribonucleotide synthase